MLSIASYAMAGLIFTTTTGYGPYSNEGDEGHRDNTLAGRVEV